MAKHSVSLIIPTLDERETIYTAIEKARRALAGRPYEVIVVDDDSPDRTWELVEELYEDNARVRCHRRLDGDCLAMAVLEGMELANGDVYAVMDADLQHPPEKLRNLLARIDVGADVVIGSRYVDGGDIEGGWPLRRAAITAGATFISHVSVPQSRRLADPMSGFFCARASVVGEAIEEMEPTGFKVLLEILAKSSVVDVEEVPFTFAPRAAGESKLDASQCREFLEHMGSLAISSRLLPLSIVGDDGN